MKIWQKTDLYILISCNNTVESNKKINRANNVEAKEASDYIIDNLGNKDIINHFSDDNFDKFQIISLLRDINTHCDWGNRYGGYSEYFSSGDKAAFVYNYKLKCGFFKYTLIFDLNHSEPKLDECRVAPIKDARTPNLQ